MNRTEVESLLFRIGVVYGPPRLSEVEQEARIQEWLELLASDAWTWELAAEAFADWKRTQEWPPKPSQFLDGMRAVDRRRPPPNALPPAPEEEPCSPEEARANLAKFRDLARGAVKRPPDDDRPTARLGDALVFDR